MPARVRRSWSRGKRRSFSRTRKSGSNYLILFLSLIVLFETLLLLFLLPNKVTHTKAKVKPATYAKEFTPLAKKDILKKPIQKPLIEQAQKKIAVNTAPVSLPLPISLPKKSKGKIAIVLDDWGYSLDNLVPLQEINLPLTLAILPFNSYSRKIAEFAHGHNFEVIIHMPMEPEEKEKLGLEPKTLMTYMSDETINSILNDAFDNIPYAKGMNNHMGSFATQDSKFIARIFRQLKKRNFYFLDSFVVFNSVCERISKDIGIKFAKRAIFLDNESKPEQIRAQLMELVYQVDKNGQAIGIGHDRKNTLLVLKEVMPQLADEGYQFVFVSELVE